MATSTSSIIQNTPTALASVTSLKPISDLLQAMVTATVLTQTADTGQVSWGGVSTSQTSTNNYEIFKLNDTLNGSFPLYIKFVYATQVTGNTPKVSVQIGTGSDGAGALTGASAAVFFRGLSNVADTNSTSIWVSAGDGYLNIWGGYNATTGTASPGGFALAIERLRDASGAITGDGVSVIGTFVYNSGTSVAYNANGTTTATSAGTIAANTHWIGSHYSSLRANFSTLFGQINNIWPPISNRGSSYYQYPLYDGTNYLAAAVQPYAGHLYAPITGILFVDSNFPNWTTQSLTLYSVAHTYLSTSQNVPAAFYGINANAAGSNIAPTTNILLNVFPAFRYE